MAEWINGIGVVIPNYNGAGFIVKTVRTALNALDALEAEGVIYVVDDASRDASVTLLKKSFHNHPRIHIIERPVNGGFGAACATGFEANRYAFVLFLNSDVLVHRDSLQAFWSEATLLENENVFAFAGNYVDAAGRPEKGSLERGQVHFGLIRTRATDDATIRSQKHNHFFANGGFTLFRSAIFKKLGGFCPLFDPFYSEDVDLSLRAARKGYRILYCPGPKGIHENSKTVKENFSNERVQTLHFRNRLLLVWMHLDTGSLWLSHLFALAVRLTVGLFSFNKIILGGFLQAAERIGPVRTERTKIDFSGKSLQTICEESQHWNR